MSFLAAIAIGAKLYGASKSRQAQQDALEDQARAKRLQAVELLERLKINTKSLRKEGQGFQQDQVASFAKGGVDVGSSITLAVLEDTRSRVDSKISNMNRIAKFEAAQLEAGAGFDLETAGSLRRAGFFEDAGTLLGGFSG